MATWFGNWSLRVLIKQPCFDYLIDDIYHILIVQIMSILPAKSLLRSISFREYSTFNLWSQLWFYCWRLQVPSFWHGNPIWISAATTVTVFTLETGSWRTSVEDLNCAQMLKGMGHLLNGASSINIGLIYTTTLYLHINFYNPTS